MTSIAKRVWKEIEDDVIIRRAMEKGIFSYKNLAKYLIKKNKLLTTSDAVISAIRRYKEFHPLEKKYEAAKNVISKTKEIRITTNIVRIALEKNKHTHDLLQKAFSLVNYEKGEILIIIQGEQFIKLMINQKNKEKILSFFPKKSIINIEDGLAEINMNLDEEAAKTPGIISALTTELMMHDINIIDLTSCLPETLIFVKQKDVVKSYEVLFELCDMKK